MSLVTDAILAKLNSLIVVVNHHGKVEYVSPSAKRILGFEPEQLIGEGWWNLTRIDELERADIKALTFQQLEQDSVMSLEMRCKVVHLRETNRPRSEYVV